MTNEKQEKVETLDENGNKFSFEVLDIINVDDVEYALLLPETKEEEQNEVLIMRLKQDGDGYAFESIDDDEEFNKVASYIEELEDELDE